MTQLKNVQCQSENFIEEHLIPMCPTMNKVHCMSVLFLMNSAPFNYNVTLNRPVTHRTSLLCC